MKTTSVISTYWKIQLTGWITASLYWGLSAFLSGNFIWKMGIVDLILDVFIGILLTQLYRNFALKNGWNKLNLKILLPRMVLSILVLSLLYTVLIVGKLYLVRLFIFKNETDSFLAFFKSVQLQVFITGTRLMSIWVLAYHLYHYSRLELETVKENARLSIIIKEAQLNNLSAQLNPHFFFNSLNNIKFLVIENPDAARRAIDLLSELLRNSLNSNIGRLISLDEEINLVRDYLELEKIRFEERLQIKIETSVDLSRHLILPFSIQSLVENAIKHGIEKRKHGGFIAVKVEKENDFIKITVRNSGKLSNEITNSGIGLSNLKERLFLQYNGNASFEIMQMENETVLATILIPSK
ncbi:MULTISPECIES: sensor histidine kinase [unclassified Flavobacterium]|uniref:sensor histidine kinase n=1 Tax=unclassified Flavobacterium TaxID=196869 RepID=UPI0012A7BC39|nr:MULTISPECIES: histidine kinase [unclassified Flavobacterium]MBF4487020.1 histidine kinase [Flavobacterium sp. CSZ]QGK75536.1 sensor histidine kinase [Flavobacterium sp. SLB02]